MLRGGLGTLMAGAVRARGEEDVWRIREMGGTPGWLFSSPQPMALGGVIHSDCGPWTGDTEDTATTLAPSTMTGQGMQE